MLRLLIIFLLAFSVCIPVYAQQDTAGKTNVVPAPAHGHLRISLITVGPGEKVWEALGHVCIRVIDSARTGEMRDIVYNYGTFDNFDEDFGREMISGTLLYYLSVFRYNFFINTFVESDRRIEEQVFLLDSSQKEALLSNLENNALPRNKYYQYNFFVDNCSTRIYYMLTKTFGNSFVFGQAIPQDKSITYFDLCRQYYTYRHWERIGVNIFFEDRMNMKVTNTASMFLPAYLSKGMAGATLNGKKLCAGKVVYEKDQEPDNPTPNGPFIVALIIAITTVAGLSFKRLSVLGKVMSFVVLFISGLTGCLILYAWFGTEHAGCENNFNLLWALPVNIIIPFLGPKIKSKYALIAIGLMGLSLIFYIARVQIMPLFELTPFLFALLCVYGMMYKTSRNKGMFAGK